jgi:hypothetical protein
MRVPPVTGADWQSEALPIHLRCYSRPLADRRGAVADGEKPRERGRADASGPNDMVLIFDTETTIDPSQRARVLFYQLRVSGRLDEEGAAYDPEVLDPSEVAILRAYCRSKNMVEPITIDAFRDQIFFGYGYDAGAEIVGFNLPFDLARIAVSWDAARVTTARGKTRPRSKMRGGFTLKMSHDNRRPNLQIRHLNARYSMIEFAAEYRQQTSRSDRKQQAYVPVHRGHFTDVATLAAALTSNARSLKSLATTLKTKTQKKDAGGHGKRLTAKYLDYARADVQVTWECFEALVARYRTYGLSMGHWQISSEASLGKAILASLGVRPWLEANPTPTPELLAKIMGSYFGGRTEVRWRKVVRRVFHTDFTAMYPTVCTLQGLWRFMTATGFETREATAEARALLESVSASDLQDRAFWPKLAMLVRITPDGDLLPVRAAYCAEKSATIGLNYLSAQPVWMTLADCIAGKLLSGKTPQVEEAIAFTPTAAQPTLKAVNFLGRYRIDPRKDDLFQRIVQLRILEKDHGETLSGVEKDVSEDLSQFLKIVANSTSYGIFIQVNVETETTPFDLEVFAPEGASFSMPFRKVERPGPYFHPLLATLITGAARLMLALAEHRAGHEGLDWVFCDTDSLALAKPDAMSDAEFEAAAQRVIAWFLPLDPYDVGKSILKAERANFALNDASSTEPLYCLAISSKRYVLFNLDAAGEPVIRKGSAHGLGHLKSPYGVDNRAPGIPIPNEDAAKDLPRWQHDLWWMMVKCALAGDIHDMTYDYHPALRRPAVSQYSATSPDLLRWFKAWNFGKTYNEGVKPFGFLYALHALSPGMGGRPNLHPVAPFHEKLEHAVRKAFDRVTQERIRKGDLETYADALGAYHLSAESKFRNGDRFDVGRTERRHVEATGVELIGKEADQLDRAFYLGSGDDLTLRYGVSPVRQQRVFCDVASAAAAFGDAAVARATGLTRAAVAGLRNGAVIKTRTSLSKIETGLRALRDAADQAGQVEEVEIESLRFAVAEHKGVRAAARALGIDPSNLAKRLRVRTEQRGLPNLPDVAGPVSGSSPGHQIE